MKITVLGAGSWGSALAHHVARSGNEVVLWGRDEAVLKSVNEHHQNSRYLQGIPLHHTLRGERDLKTAVQGAEVIVFSLPSHATRSGAEALAPYLSKTSLVVSTAKGLEEGSLLRMTELLAKVLGDSSRVSALSGPSFALEVAKGLPTAVTIAAEGKDTLEKVSRLFHFDNIRVYRSNDVLGVELGGTVKNVIALAAGIVDGMNLGLNARAALITRGLAEMKRLIEKLGGQATTVMGLSGLGDLLLTATGELSRNRTVGMALGRGEALEDIIKNLGQVAEGVKAAKQVQQLASVSGVEMPIVLEVASLLEKKVSPQQAVKNLLTRGLKDE